MVAVVGDLLLRFNWILTLLPIQSLVSIQPFSNPHLGVEFLLFLTSFLEIFRRAFWTLFRIENEKFSNVEKYRQVDFVPKIPNLIVE